MIDDNVLIEEGSVSVRMLERKREKIRRVQGGIVVPDRDELWIEIEQATADEIPASWLSVLQRYGRGTTRSSPLDGKKFILAGSIRLIFTTSGPTT